MPPPPVRAAAALLTATLAGVHVYWAAGGRAGMAASLLQNDEGQPLFTPPPVMTLGVAAGLATMSAAALNANSPRMRWPLRLIALVFLLRAVGDGRWVGLTRQRRGTAFARNDARLYTPLCLVLAALFGALGWRR
ncbi:DUF3995 domain-containing protein [Deinococcus sp. YIM 134068]|uniref:DUF3995 domain-containing protein n=1 Tax=Deinococcus lichenicola TaxID=3118910 RepID=UPI002F932D8D